MSKKPIFCWYAIASVAVLAMVLGAAARAQDGASRAPARAALLSLMAAPPQQQQEASGSEQSAGEKKSTAPGSEELSPLQEAFHWINFLIVAGGIAWLVKKYLTPFLAERGKLIREDMDRSTKSLADANQRLAMVEDKLKHLDEELASLRQAASQEGLSERQRMEEAASADAVRILAAAEQEIEASVKAARQQLKLYAAELAVSVAESKIRAALTPQSEQRILQGFVNDLASDGNGQAGASTPGKQS
jgi:F-type H+-transporting ATPase subunit b